MKTYGGDAECGHIHSLNKTVFLQYHITGNTGKDNEVQEQ
jgi:hypothetical protein